MNRPLRFALPAAAAVFLVVPLVADPVHAEPRALPPDVCPDEAAALAQTKSELYDARQVLLDAKATRDSALAAYRASRTPANLQILKAARTARAEAYDDVTAAKDVRDAARVVLDDCVVVAIPIAITSIDQSPLVPGSTATLTGRGFSPTMTDNTVSIGGAAAAVTGATATTLTVTVPCVASDPLIDVKATVSGAETPVFEHPLSVNQRDLDVGEAAIITDAAEVGCNEIASADGAARYVIAAYNASTSPTSSSGIQLSGDSAGGQTSQDPRGTDVLARVASVVDASSDLVLGDDDPEQLEAPEDGDAHLDLMNANREQYEVLRKEFGTDGVAHRGGQRDLAATDLPMNRTFRISNINASNICNSYYVGSATRVYAEGKLVIYEDDATPEAFKAANSPAMADYYDRIGDQFNADMEPIIRNNFGDILRRDAVTDNNGVMVAVSTPRINTSFSGVAGFVVSCDQFPNDDSAAPGVGGPYTGSGINGASNLGEYFYLYQPVTNATGYSGNTPDNWYRTVRSTFIHESKHVASMAARTDNNAPFEASWLEEGTARLAEELWGRDSVYGMPWKGNNGYGSAAAPKGIYCDVRPGFAECAEPSGPVSVMQRHFTSLYTHLFGANARLLSPFGRTASDNASYFYAISWSLIRYAIDRYGASDSDFLTALTDSSTTGVTNVGERTGVSTDKLLGGWALALATDDYPGLTGASADVDMPTWNFRNIYAGLNQDFPSTYTLTYPSTPDSLGFGSIAPINVTTLYGGGVRYFQLSGTQTQPQLLRLLGYNGAALGSTIRLAVVRVQ